MVTSRACASSFTINYFAQLAAWIMHCELRQCCIIVMLHACNSKPLMAACYWGLWSTECIEVEWWNVVCNPGSNSCCPSDSGSLTIDHWIVLTLSCKWGVGIGDGQWASHYSIRYLLSIAECRCGHIIASFIMALKNPTDMHVGIQFESAKQWVHDNDRTVDDRWTHVQSEWAQ